jgi:putative addiction module component (TIGR02574 family)
MGKSDLQALFALSVAERIELAEELWDSVAADAESQSLAPHEIAEVRQRLEEHQANPDAIAPWSQVKKKLGLPE